MKLQLVLFGVVSYTLLLFFYISWGVDSAKRTAVVQLGTRTLTTGQKNASGAQWWEERNRRPAPIVPHPTRRKMLDASNKGGLRFRRPLDFENFSEGNKAVQGLWSGQASSHMLSHRLQRAKNGYMNVSVHNVTYAGQRREPQGAQDVLCQLKQQKLRTVDGTEEPFSRLGWRQLVPVRALQQLAGAPFRTCAVVSSAGALLRSSLGKEIDSHDAVLRFNAAPTKGFEYHVGSKTTIRIINSQVLADPRHHFANSSLYNDCTLLAWDPSSYSADLEKWYSKPDYDLFTAYAKRRKRSPSQPFYILHPAFIWRLWDVLQNNTDEKIQANPPSSGFIGIVVMLSLCEQVDVYEFIPSKKHTPLCHYYEHYRDVACTLGAYHPLLYEKLLVRRMTSTSMDNLSKEGKAVLSGFSQITC
ncbi:beta-galactoside alpha-2,6-sialyltransferase 2b [Brachyhypopomus gauderio]|uniref:beta-galactoside alpha-2,6-sialyltransferase 2b n=1 Tax=Brachyhypopomus gauderio TaxID=698409 RepID=UPI0040427CAC